MFNLGSKTYRVADFEFLIAGQIYPTSGVYIDKKAKIDTKL